MNHFTSSTPIPIENGVNLARFTTLGVGGPAEFLCRPSNSAELLSVLQFSGRRGIPVTLLGGGSNVVVDDAGIPGLTVLTRRCNEIDIVAGDVVWASSGVYLPHLAKFAHERGRSGWEFMSVIPGTIGGACRINAGLGGGSQMQDCVASVSVWSIKNGVRELPLSDLQYRYRNSILMELKDEVVLGAKLFMGKITEQNAIGMQMQMLADRRRDKFPSNSHNCGSVFKAAPDGTPAGRLLEQAGMKGRKFGGCQIASEHANWIVNVNNATSACIWLAVASMKRAVMDRFGVELEVEVVKLPTERTGSVS